MMFDFADWDSKLVKLYSTYARLDECVKNKIEYQKRNILASESELCEVETNLGRKIPPSLREVFLRYSSCLKFSAHLPNDIELPNNLRHVSRAYFVISVEELVRAEMERIVWIKDCFSDPEDSYDKIWHDKLGFMTAPNGDIIAFDLNDPKDDKRVVYLSHDDGDGHGYILGESFGEYFSNLLLVGACGNEDWQMIPFIADHISGINPNCDNAQEYRRIIGLTW